MSDVTAILLNYKRPANLPRLIASLKAQSVPVEIVVIDNGMKSNPYTEYGVGLTWNAGPYVRYLVAALAKTPWVAFFDDDLCPGDPDFIGDALDIATCHEGITGTFARRLSLTPPHYREPDVIGEAELIKGRFMLFRRDLLERMHLTRPWFTRYAMHCDDLYISLEIGRGQPVHWADKGLKARLEELPAGDVGLEKQPDHFLLREAFCAHYIREVLR